MVLTMLGIVVVPAPLITKKRNVHGYLTMSLKKNLNQHSSSGSVLSFYLPYGMRIKVLWLK